jgi:hypothetical protein
MTATEAEKIAELEAALAEAEKELADVKRGWPAWNAAVNRANAAEADRDRYHKAIIEALATLMEGGSWVRILSAALRHPEKP